MTHKIFIFLTATSFMLAPFAPQLSDVSLGKGTLKEAKRWNDQAAHEGCEGNYTLEEANETCRGINKECKLGKTERELESCKAILYANVIRFVNAKRKRVRRVAINNLDLQSNFEESRSAAIASIDEMLASGSIHDPALMESLTAASEMLARLTLGYDALNEEAPRADEAMAAAQNLIELASGRDDLAAIVAAACVELESYAETAIMLADHQQVLAKTMIPHVTHLEGGFRTDFILTNKGSKTHTFTLQAYDKHGQAIEMQFGEIPPYETLALKSDEIFNSKDVSHVAINEARDINVAVSYRSNDNGCPAHLLASDKAENTWLMFPGDWDQVWDGLAMVNQGHKPANIEIRQLNNKGVVVQSVQLESMQGLAPMGKATVVLNDLGFSPLPHSQFQISSNQNLSVLSLRGSLNDQSNFMWENPVIAD